MGIDPAHSSYAAAFVLQTVQAHPQGIVDIKLLQLCLRDGISRREASDALTLLQHCGYVDRKVCTFYPGQACAA